MAKPPQKAEAGQPKGHAERLQFNQLIATNPNYFGNFTAVKLKPVFPLSNDTTYEELTCVGYNPDFGVLEAVIHVKQPTGYSGDNCSTGSFEYIRFYVDTGGGFQDAGLVAINVHDLPNGTDCAKQANKPLSYAASVPYSPPNAEDCDDPVLPTVRAILSWQAIPTSPTFPVTWGNSLDRHIQLKPGPTTIQDIIEDLFEGGALPIDLKAKIATVPSIPIPPPDPAPLTLTELVALYTGKQKQVPAHRFGFAEVQSVLAAPAVSSELVASKIAAFAALKIDWAAIIGTLGEKDADVSYEQLNCLGLEGGPGFERLAATFEIKQNLGYSGNLCTAGSFEYIAFWADWDNTCTYTYLGTVPVNVHDINRPAGEDLYYTAVLPVDLSAHRTACGDPKIARVRAVLSWATPPSTADPNALNYWGNSIDAHVQILPGAGTSPLNPKISILGGIPTSQIDPISGFTVLNARFAGNNLLADSLGRACPFGGRVEVQGPEFPGYRYRIQVRDITSGGSWQTVSTPLILTRWDGTTYISNPDVNGYFDYQQYTNNIENLLGNWDSSGDDLWEVKIDIADFFDNPIAGAIPDIHRVQLDNTAPSAAVHIDSAGDCGKFGVGITLSGHFVARDANFGSYSLGTLPFAGPVTPGSGTTQTAVAPGDPWSLNTTGMTPCGYDLHLAVADRSIVNSAWGNHNFAAADTGFCLLANV
ncbi:MAG TPA: hypothetical protein VKB88_18725 [Bryobacteraceae bacterium]|nr:hypothetical protein [Bryobacteraceae bacterium]